MNVHKWIPFLLIITFFIALVETYVLYHWTRFAKKRGMPKYVWITPWIISGLVLLVSLWLNMDRIFNDEIMLRYNTLLIIASFWYMPKLIIVPFLLVKDLIKLFKYITFSLRNKNKIQAKEIKTNLADKKRREVLSTIGWAMALVPFGLAGYGILSTSRNIKVHRHKFEFARFPQNIENFRIVQISDIHAGSFTSKSLFIQTRLMVNNLNPDLIVITGDFVNFRIEELDIISDELSLLRANYGVLGCWGNHDHYVGEENMPEFARRLESLGVKMLVNSNHVIDTGMGKVQIAGVDNTGMSYQNFADFDKALSGLDESNSIVLLCHDPTNWDKSIRDKLDIDLTLSGHTHGGQFAVDIFGKVISPAELVYKQWAGLYSSKDGHLYVNRGIGMTGPPFRMGINPEITVIDIKRASNLV